ncbi:MAG TPA: hypothetical protein PK734_02890 [Bacteroidales bacterium]|nr:MAG: hypothetical protein BWY22_01537 [Bacteroidetes bacterium ADurb.Bin217]HPM12420.1 hypothetical protein [Bacteroidales bacterium]
MSSFKILALWYSQTGQLHQIITHFLQPLTETNSIDIDIVEYKPAIPYPFPWSSQEFFNTMPESVLLTPTPLAPLNFAHSSYDLIVLAYQPWYLSPSIPANSLFHTPEFLHIIRNTPVITLIGSRNMWINSQEIIKKQLHTAGANLIGNIAFSDKHQNQISAITIVHWMLSGRKDKKYGIFPLPGISTSDIQQASEYGTVLHTAIQSQSLQGIQSKFLALGYMNIPLDVQFIEERAKRLFTVWAQLITKFGSSLQGRKRLVTTFKWYLIIALFIVAPIVFFFYFFLFYPFTYKAVNKKKQIYLQ